MDLRHAQPVGRIALEVELDKYDRLLANHPAIVPGFDGDNLRGFEFDNAAVAVLDVDFAVDEEPDVGVHAEIGADDRFHVLRPSESHRIHHPLDAPGSGTTHLDPNVAHLTTFCAPHWRKVQWCFSVRFRGGALP
jgi:hypothetical protein